MVETITSNSFFGMILTGLFFLIGTALHRRWTIALFTPLVFAIVCIIVLLLLLDIPYEAYNQGGGFISLWITPATVALAIKLEKNFVYLKKYYVSILTGITLGVIFHTVLIIILSTLFQFNEELAATLFPKSVTTAIALGVSESLGGIVSLTVALVVFTGILGTVIGPPIFSLFKIDDPVAQGVALGSGSHAMGTTKAIELGEVQGAMSGLSIILTGLVVVAVAPIAMQVIHLFF